MIDNFEFLLAMLEGTGDYYQAQGAAAIREYLGETRPYQWRGQLRKWDDYGNLEYLEYLGKESKNGNDLF